MFKVKWASSFPFWSRNRRLVVNNLSWNWKTVFSYLERHTAIDDIVEHRLKMGKDTFFLFRIKSSFNETLSDGKKPFTTRFAQGFDFNRERALSVAIGEYLERESFLYYKRNEHMISSAAELARVNKRVFTPDEVSVFTLQQKRSLPESNYTRESEFAWVHGKELILQDNQITEAESLAPAQTIYWMYRTRFEEGKQEPLLREIGTHGGAGYFTKSGALKRALLEWYGRDRFMRAWFTGGGSYKLSLDHSLPKLLRQRVLSITAAGFLPSLIVIKDEGPIYTVFCTLQEDTKEKRLLFGSGCEMSLEEACLSALEEALSVSCWFRERRHNWLSNSALQKIPLVEWGDRERLNFFQYEEGRQSLSEILDSQEHPFSYLIGEGKFDVKDSDQVELILRKIWRNCPSARVFYSSGKQQALSDLSFYTVKILVTDLFPMFHNLNLAPGKYLEKIQLTKNLPPGFYPHPYP